MKANLWCCYLCDAPTGCIKNSQILSVDKIGCICTRKKCATTTRKIFLFFFWVGPPALLIMFFLGGPARAPHEVGPSQQAVKQFIFI